MKVSWFGSVAFKLVCLFFFLELWTIVKEGREGVGWEGERGGLQEIINLANKQGDRSLGKTLFPRVGCDTLKAHQTSRCRVHEPGYGCVVWAGLLRYGRCTVRYVEVNLVAGVMLDNRMAQGQIVL